MGYDSRMRKRDVEPCLYFIRDKDLMVIILAYVDDYLVATDSKPWYDGFVAAFHSNRPDIMAAASILSRFTATYGPSHFVALKQVVRNMYMRELIKDKETEALYTGTTDNTADIMTKPLALPIFHVHREPLGVMNLSTDKA
ncbi:hypothetical protein CYMTET_13150 [Cymbomonas tetramitiformis]|uniref:Reverse transcriptase Ty1/copia-type domain-containing protein n=1 Tax=Cymbomonas tetramitiformis TaxID=36881 RepID=A0AAE0LBH3_9CHLO|nr:hypothetical protein CYMTET_13150 [Cymbomonas tetramitiformis]